MRINKEHFIVQAKRLDHGCSTKIPHDGCSSSPAMQISNNAQGYSAYCHKCSGKGFVPHNALSLGEIQAYRQAQIAEEQRQTYGAIKLPADFSHTIATVGLVWLWKYGITDKEIETFGIGWSDKLQRVILPVYNNCDKLLIWQGRSVNPAIKPKYLNIGGTSKGVQRHFIRERKGSKELYIVEDILSAIKVGRHRSCMSVLGTSVNHTAYTYMRRYEAIRLWFDDDPAGYKARRAFKKDFGASLKISTVRSSRDPKCYSNREIRRIIKMRRYDTDMVVEGPSRGIQIKYIVVCFFMDLSPDRYVTETTEAALNFKGCRRIVFKIPVWPHK